MKTLKAVAAYQRLRGQPLWRLLAADLGPLVLGMLQAHLYDSDRSLPASIFHERIARDLETLRSQGEPILQTAQAYIANWLAEGYLIRRFPAGRSEEEYELATPAVEAIRFVSGLEQPRQVVTESRLNLVIQALVQLAEDSDTDQHRRIERLLAEQARIDQEIDAIRGGRLHVLSEDSALERTREIIHLADDLAGDFRRVRDEFDKLNRDLRERLMDHDVARGQVLESLFVGVDLIAESDAGRTFSAFWRMLTDPQQSATLEVAIDDVTSRSFVTRLDSKDRRFLFSLTRNLLEQGGHVHEVLQSFARSLKHFVQSREYLEQRRLHQLLKEAQRAALDLKDEVKATETLHYVLDLTSARITSFSQWQLHDPNLQAVPEPMCEGAAPLIDLQAVGELVSQSEIDFRTLKVHICAVLQECSQASIADVLERFPAEQGLGSVLGLLALGSRHGFKGEQPQMVSWVGGDEQYRQARIPTVFFVRERIDELR